MLNSGESRTAAEVGDLGVGVTEEKSRGGSRKRKKAGETASSPSSSTSTTDYTTFMGKMTPHHCLLSNGKKTKGRVKIKMEFIENKLRRYTTFSKRKTGIMKKAYELATLTGTQVLLLVASETGHVYTFATRKLQPMITSDEGKQLIQTCLSSEDDCCADQQEGHRTSPLVEMVEESVEKTSNGLQFSHETPQQLLGQKSAAVVSGNNSRKIREMLCHRDQLPTMVSSSSGGQLSEQQNDQSATVVDDSDDSSSDGAGNMGEEINVPLEEEEDGEECSSSGGEEQQQSSGASIFPFQQAAGTLLYQLGPQGLLCPMPPGGGTPAANNASSPVGQSSSSSLGMLFSPSALGVMPTTSATTTDSSVSVCPQQFITIPMVTLQQIISQSGQNAAALCAVNNSSSADSDA